MSNSGDEAETDEERNHRDQLEIIQREADEQRKALKAFTDMEKKKARTAFQADRLRQARIAAGYKTATEAAQKLGFVESTYLAHENGSRGAPYQQMGTYARAFGVNVSWLIYGEEPDTTGSKLRPDLLRIKGFIHRGHWLEGSGFLQSTPETRAMTIPVVPDKRYFKADQYAVRAETRLASLANAGECLIVADWESLETERARGLTPTDFYLVQRSRGDMHALVAWKGDWIREIIPSASEAEGEEHAYAWTLKDPVLTRSLAAGEQLKIIGLVIGKYAPREALTITSA